MCFRNTPWGDLPWGEGKQIYKLSRTHGSAHKHVIFLCRNSNVNKPCEKKEYSILTTPSLQAFIAIGREDAHPWGGKNRYYSKKSPTGYIKVPHGDRFLSEGN